MISTVGRVAEWFKAPVLKTGVPARVPWVRIPPLPPETVHQISPAITDKAETAALLGVWLIQLNVEFVKVLRWMAQARARRE